MRQAESKFQIKAVSLPTVSVPQCGLKRDFKAKQGMQASDKEEGELESGQCSGEDVIETPTKRVCVGIAKNTPLYAVEV
jgi:hypothetical protein